MFTFQTLSHCHNSGLHGALNKIWYWDPLLLFGIIWGPCVLKTRAKKSKTRKANQNARTSSQYAWRGTRNETTVQNHTKPETSDHMTTWISAQLHLTVTWCHWLCRNIPHWTMNLYNKMPPCLWNNIVTATCGHVVVKQKLHNFTLKAKCRVLVAL